MKYENAKFVYFSPTGTTRSIVHSIANGMKIRNIKLIDISQPEARSQSMNILENELLLFAVPVYMGRTPALLYDFINSIHANNTPAVCVVVYGNRAFDDALLELKDALEVRGCIPFAGAAFIGEHSFSSNELPTAHGRPDEKDLKYAEDFGRKIQQKLFSLDSIAYLDSITFPGNNPYGGVTKIWDVDFIKVGNECNQCGICADMCPVGAIDLEKSDSIDIIKCISCCACIKYCPQKARSIKASLVNDAALRLHTLYSERKEPEFFI